MSTTGGLERLASSLVPDEVRATALERLDLLPDGDRLLHGDFHPANLLRTSSGYVVVDWTNGTRGDPAADVARTLLLIGGDIPDHAPADIRDHAPAVVRLVLPVAQRSVVGMYLRAYGRVRPLDRVARWKRVWAAARLSEDIPAERDFLLAEVR